MRNPTLRKRQSGITLLEILASVGIMAAVIAGVARLADQYVDDTKSALVAQQVVAVGNAAQAYIKDNYTTVMGNATATTPALITVPMLTAAGYLQTGFATKNTYGHDLCVLVLEPSANNLNALVVTEGGTAIDDLTLGSVAVGIGAAGGGVYSSASTTLRGAMGGWSMAVGSYANANNANQKCNGTGGTPTIAAGHPVMALWFSNGDVTSGFLYRNSVPGRPELNTMNTPLVMNSIQTAGGACTTTGAIARDNTGGILTCQSATWKTAGGSMYWRDPVANYAALPASGDPVGAVRVTTNTGRAFMWTGGAWAALSVDQNGNLTVPGTLTAAGGKVIAWNSVGEGGVLQLVGDNGVSMYLESQNGKFRLMNSPWSAEVFSVDQAGNVVANGRLATNEYLQLNATVTEGSACSPNGLVSRDTNGLLLSCQSGSWRSQYETAGPNFVKFPSGVIIHWGTYTSTSAGSDKTWAGGFSFPATVYSMVNNCPKGYDTVNTKGVAGFNSNATDGGQVCSYIATGR